MVLGRVASNFYSPRNPKSKENTPPHVKTYKSSLSSIASLSRRRRARNSGIPDRQRHAVQTAHKRASTRTPPSIASRTERDNGHPPQQQFLFHQEAPPPCTPPPSYQNIYGDVEMQEVMIATDRGGSRPTTVRLPRTLARPQYREISKYTLAAINPDLAEVSIEYIREGLQHCGSSLMSVLACTSSNPPKDSLSHSIDVSVSNRESDLPTHMLALYAQASTSAAASSGDNGPCKITLFPTHSIVMAAHCANFPRLPPLDPSASPEWNDDEETDQPIKVTLPVVPLCVPSPQTFPQLCAYLYTKRADKLLASLLPSIPLPPSYLPALSPSLPQTEPPTDTLATLSLHTHALYLSHTHTQYSILQRIATINGLWRNVCALGVFDDELWTTMDVAWDVLVTALAAAGAASTKTRS